MLEKQISLAQSAYTQDLFEKVAAGKSAVCYAMVHAMNSLSRNLRSIENIKNCLCHLHIAMQYVDDLDDFKKDFLDGQFTYAHYLVEQYLVNKGIEVNTLSVAERHRYLYTSGVANQMLEQATNHYEKSIVIAHSFELFELVKYIKLSISKAKKFQWEIEQLFRKTKIKITKSLQFKNNIYVTSQLSLQTALREALEYLKNNRDEKGCWSDFMTSAGQSTLWVTAYAGLLLAETKQGLGTAHEAFDASFFLPKSYNSSIMQDGDSTNFAMGLRQKVWGENNQSQLSDWLFFMDNDGGWVTYRNEDELRKRLALPDNLDVNAWLTPKSCVTAAAAYVLKMYKELADQYTASCNYLIKHQHPDGYWSSYWWTSPIYATSFAVLALGTDSAYTTSREAGLHWIATHQATNGAWFDATSNQQPSAFFTALAIKALLIDESGKYILTIEKGIYWLLTHQTTDGSWVASHILRIPATDVSVPTSVREWRISSFGVNTIIDDHNRIFTTSTVLNALSMFAKITETELLTAS